MLHYGHKPILDLFNPIWVGQKSSDKHVGIWHCLVLSILESLIFIFIFLFQQFITQGV